MNGIYVLEDYGPHQCLKQVVTATIVSVDGRRFVATNYIQNTPVGGCPRSGLATGEGYHLCREICGQIAHAEINVIALAGDHAKGGVLYLSGHTYACQDCLNAANRAGIIRVVIGEPE